MSQIARILVQYGSQLLGINFPLPWAPINLSSEN
jgi:hypothetical protein